MNDHLLTEISTENNLIQQFYEIGADNEIVFCERYYQNVLKFYNQNANIKPNIISKFPNVNSTLVNIPNDVIISHCFPNGFYAKFCKDEPPIGEKFFFCVDNFPRNSNYPKVYFSCFLFYESLEVYRQILLKKKNFIFNSNNNDKESDDEQNLGNSIIGCSNYYIPKVICFASLLPYPRELTKILKTLYNKYLKIKEGYEYPIEKIIENLIFSIPIPTRGKYSISYHLFNEKYSFTQSPINKVPNVSYELNLIFSTYKISDILFIFKCVLLEIPLLFFSDSKAKLCTLVEGFLSLIYPFSYKHHNISILPYHCYSIIETSDCFMLGINEEYHSNFFINNNLEVENKTIVIVDIDNKKIEIIAEEKEKVSNCDINDFNCIKDNCTSYNSQITDIDLPLHYKKKLSDQMVKYLKKLKEYMIKNEDKDSFNNTIRNAFFYFMTSIFFDYERYIKYDKNSFDYIDKYLYTKSKLFDINEIFNVKEYINAHSIDVDFYKKFITTEIFKAFLIKKIYPITFNDKFDILFFDEKIIEKQNKSILTKTLKTPFINIDEFSNLLKVPTVEPNNFTENEILSLFEKESMYNALDYFQLIQTTTSNKLSIKYLLFPKLLYDNAFFKSKYSETFKQSQIHPPVNIQSEFITKYSYILSSKTYLDIYQNNISNPNNTYEYCFTFYETFSKMRNIQMDNYIYLSWLAMFALSFSYISTVNERNFRFAEANEILSNIEYINDEILILLFYVMNEYGENSEIVSLYEIIEKSNEISKFYVLYNVMCMRMAKTFNPSLSNRKVSTLSSRASVLMREKKESVDKEENVKEEQFERRILFIDDENSFTFETLVECNCCNELTELNFLFNTNDKFYCQSCQREIKPTINVEINKKRYERFDVLTPKQLYEKIRFNFFTNNEYKIDVNIFYKNYNCIFWNCVLYFSMRNLSFDFIIPYERHITNSDMKREDNENTKIEVYEDLTIESSTQFECYN